MNLEDIAKVAHECNRAYCQTLGDYSQPPWEEAPQWQKDSAIVGVQAYQNDPAITPRQGHENWMEIKLADGWKYGKTKNPDKKEHPCMVSYEELPPEQRVKDSLFLSVVKTLSSNSLS